MQTPRMSLVTEMAADGKHTPADQGQFVSFSTGTKQVARTRIACPGKSSELILIGLFSQVGLLARSGKCENGVTQLGHSVSWRLDTCSTVQRDAD